MALFVLSLCPFDISVGVGAFVIGLGQISSFLSFALVGDSQLHPMDVIWSNTLFPFVLDTDDFALVLIKVYQSV